MKNKLINFLYMIKQRKTNIMQKFISLLFVIFLIIGKSFETTGSFDLIKNHPVFLTITGLFLFYIFNKLFVFLDYSLEKEEKKPKKYLFLELLSQHPFKISLILISCVWIIYIISWYPGIISPDPTTELRAYFNMPSKITENATLINPNIHWTTQHSILHTLNLGVAVEFGNFINNVNLGFFLLYTLPQVLSMILIFAYTIKFMKDNGVSSKILIFVLSLYIFVPMYPLYAITAHKTIYYNILIMIYIMLLFDYLKNYTNKKYPVKKVLLLSIIAILTTLFRNEGKFIILLSLPLILFIKNINKYKIIISISLIIILLLSYENIFIKKMEITPQNSAAYLSIPFQQIARYVNIYEEELSESDIEIIDNILVYDTLAERYIPQFADSVNDYFNSNATQEEINEFLQVWFKHLLKHPDCFIEAFIHQNYTFFYPTYLDWYVYQDDLNTHELQEVATLSYTESLENSRILEIYLAYFQYLYIPILRYLLYNGTHFWILLIASYYIFKNNKKYIITTLPLYLIFLICLLGPSNWYRYSLPITFSIPIIIGITCFTLKNPQKMES